MVMSRDTEDIHGERRGKASLGPGVCEEGIRQWEGSHRQFTLQHEVLKGTACEQFWNSCLRTALPHLSEVEFDLYQGWPYACAAPASVPRCWDYSHGPAYPSSSSVFIFTLKHFRRRTGAGMPHGGKSLGTGTRKASAKGTKRGWKMLF